MVAPARPRPFRIRASRTIGPGAAVALSAVLAGVLVAPAEAGSGTGSGPDVPKPIAGWEHDRPAPGVDLYSGDALAGRAGADHWTETIRTAGATLVAESEAQALAERLRAAGFSPRTEKVSWPAEASDRRGPLGVRVRVGTHDDRAPADAQRQALVDAGFDAVTEWTGGDGTEGTGTAKTKVAVIDPRQFGGSLANDYGTAVAGREKVTDMAAKSGALLGINAGFFVMEGKDGVPGAAAGVAAYDGELQSAATNGRIAAVLRGDGLQPEFKHLRTELRVRGAAGSETVDGVNRAPGLIRNCGGVGGDQPTERPRHDVTCTDAHEIVRFTDELGDRTPAGEGVEVVLDGKGQVLELRPRGGEVPAGGDVLAGVGTGASWLNANAKPGSVLTLDERIADEHGRTVRLGADDDIVNGGPQLVRDGAPAVDFGADGIDRPGEPSFPYAWGLKRNPRTAMGVDGQGRIILVAAAGRQPGYSDGLSVAETARLMDSLGAVDAMNLDGGGSTAMTLDGKPITSPSDATGERAVGDALLLNR